MGEEVMSHFLSNLFPDAMINRVLRDETMVVSKFVRSLKGEEANPILVLFVMTDEDEPQRVLVPITRFPPEKHEFLRGVGSGIGGSSVPVVAALLVSEAWLKHVSHSEAWRAKKDGLPIPSKCPDRQEVVIVSVRTIDGRGAFASAPIKVDKEGRGVGDWSFVQEAKTEFKDNMLGSFFEGYVEGFMKERSL